MDELVSAACLSLASNRIVRDRDMSQLMAALSALERGLQQANAEGTLPDVASRFGEHLQDILSEVEILLKEPNVRMANGRLVGFRDRVFRGMLPDIQNIKHTQQVTRVFNAFVRGITYFASEAVSHRYQPVYHRLGSCPPRGRDNPKCVPENTTNTRRVKKGSIEKCYIERCIYDSLWSRFVGTQDAGHLIWLQNTKQAYRTCFPDVDVVVHVEYDAKTNLPVSLQVTAFQDGALVWSAHYKKYLAMYGEGDGLYEPRVVCVRQQGDTVSTKVNTFEREEAWMPRSG
jgi:hypothetical protein